MKAKLSYTVRSTPFTVTLTVSVGAMEIASMPIHVSTSAGLVVCGEKGMNSPGRITRSSSPVPCTQLVALYCGIMCASAMASVSFTATV